MITEAGEPTGGLPTRPRATDREMCGGSCVATMLGQWGPTVPSMKTSDAGTDQQCFLLIPEAPSAMPPPVSQHRTPRRVLHGISSIPAGCCDLRLDCTCADIQLYAPHTGPCRPGSSVYLVGSGGGQNFTADCDWQPAGDFRQPAPAGSRQLAGDSRQPAEISSREAAGKLNLNCLN